MQTHAAQFCRAGGDDPVISTPIPVKYAFHKFGIDLVGTLQVTSAGNMYIMTCIDYLSKWVEARALSDKTSKQVADFFYADIVCRHGTPAEVISDQVGSNSRALSRIG